MEHQLPDLPGTAIASLLLRNVLLSVSWLTPWRRPLEKTNQGGLTGVTEIRFEFLVHFSHLDQMLRDIRLRRNDASIP